MGSLVLTRRVGTTLHIGDDIIVTVMPTDRRIVRLHIHSPSGNSVSRLRETGASVRVATNITITLLGKRSTDVKLGIEAPRHIIVDRAEIRARRLANPNPANDNIG